LAAFEPIERRVAPYLGLVRSVWRSDPRQSAALTVVVMLRSAAPFVFAISAAVVVSKVPDAVRHGLSSAPGHNVIAGLVAMGISFAVQQIGPAIQLSLADSLGRRFNAELDQRLMRLALTPRGVAHLEDPAVGEQLAAARQAVSGWPRPGDAVAALSGRVAMHVSIWAGALLLVTFHVWAAVLMLGASVYMQRRLAVSIAALGQSQVGRAAALRETGYLRDVALLAPAAKEVRIFGLGGWLVDRHVRAWRTASASMRSAQQKGQRQLVVASVAMCTALAAVVGALGWQISRGTVGLAAVAVSLQALALVTRSIGDEQAIRDGMVLGYAMGASATERDLEAHLSGRISDLPGRASAAGLPQRDIRFRDVRFAYPGTDREVLRGLDLDLRAGESLGVVGLNGAGKTTLIKLLCRLYEPTSGSVTIDGVELSELDAGEWQRQVAAIFQDYVHYPFTAAENVDVAADPALLERASRAAGLSEIVEALPSGWDTPLSPQLRGGVDLSGGQWQRLALARALYAAANGARVLVLDEPTANLDVRGEAEIYNQFLELTQGLTTILISHRLSSVRLADRIAVIDDGRLHELGTHDELMKLRGRYAELFDLQAAAFRTEAATA